MNLVALLLAVGSSSPTRSSSASGNDAAGRHVAAKFKYDDHNLQELPARLRTTGASPMLAADLVENLLIAQFFLSAPGAMGGVWTFTLFLAAVLPLLLRVVAGTASPVNARSSPPVICPATAD
jgi:hypothetical protein